MKALPRLVLLLLILASPAAHAHVSNYGDTKVIAAGPYGITVSPTTSPIFANEGFALQVSVSDRSGEFVAQDVQLTVVAPDGNVTPLAGRRNVEGTVEAPLLLTQRGNHTLVASLRDANGTHEGRTWLDVYPDLPLRIIPLDQSQDIVPGELVGLAVLAVDPKTEKPYPLEDLRGTVELWNTDHSVMLQQDNVTFQKTEIAGAWKMEHRFPEMGMYHMRFASESGGFGVDDLPLLHTYATPAPDSSGPGATRPTPATPMIALFALAFLALARRR